MPVLIQKVLQLTKMNKRTQMDHQQQEMQYLPPQHYIIFHLQVKTHKYMTRKQNITRKLTDRTKKGQSHLALCSITVCGMSVWVPIAMHIKIYIF